jgi:hypothetical protein
MPRDYLKHSHFPSSLFSALEELEVAPALLTAYKLLDPLLEETACDGSHDRVLWVLSPVAYASHF